jgi:hypothetical protein
MLGERELQNKCAPYLSIFEDVEGNPSIRKKRCPVTPCVRTHRDGPYHPKPEETRGFKRLSKLEVDGIIKRGDLYECNLSYRVKD